MTSFAILVLGAPVSTQSVNTAFQFASAAVTQGHRVLRVFFYHDGVYAGNDAQIAAAEQTSIPQQWRALAQRHQIDLVVCVASALKRGVLDNDEAHRYEQPAGHLAQGFELSGLGQWTEACLLAERVVSFGP